MRHVKVKDAKPGMVVTGTVERGDLPEGPFTITSVTKVGRGVRYRIAAATPDGTDAGSDDFPAAARFKVIS